MMKKLPLLCVAFFTASLAVKAQSQPSGTVTVAITDTLDYFYNKQLYKLPTATGAATVHPVFKSKAMVITNTFITHVGSIFKNADTVNVYGLQSRVLRPAVSVSGAPNGVPLRMYLCKVVSGLPVFPPLDSIQAYVLNNSNVQYGQYVGASFTNGPKTVIGDFAVLIRNSSDKDGDTVKIFRTAGYTATATTAPDNAHKFGEGLGVVRNGGVFYKTTNYNDPAFGPGTDYEFCVSPMVTFTAQLSEIQSGFQFGACEWAPFTNTLTASSMLGNHQFNFNEFYRVLKPFGSAMPNSFVPDSVFTWDMGDGPPFYYSAAGSNTVSLLYGNGVSNVFYTGSLTAKYKPMSTPQSTNANTPSYSVSLSFTGSTVWCNDSAGSGIHELGNLAYVKIYPNPTTDKTTISGLTGKNTILVYDVLGQLVSTQVTEEETYTVDLLKQPRGTYLLRINNSENNTRIVKIIRD